MKYFDVVANRRACLSYDEKAISPKPPKVQTAKWNSDLLGGRGGGMTSSNLKIGAKLSHGVVAVLKSLHFALP